MDDELNTRVIERMNDLLAEPVINGDYKLALFAACSTFEIFTDHIGEEIQKLLTRVENLPQPPAAISIPHPPTKKRAGRPKGKSNPIPGRITDAAMIAAIWARYKGITNNREAAEKFLPKLSVFDADTQTVKNFQKTISAARKKYSL